MPDQSANQADSPERALPTAERVLADLKPFQRRSVDYVFDRLYGPDATRRFLLADEVGLGKTLVARGVIARTIEHLQDKVKRIDIVYICSNQDIARQNINRLNISEGKDFSLASRITLLPLTARGEKRSQFHDRLNFVSFTPGTSFDLKSTLGISTERALLYYLLRDAWQLHGNGPKNLLQGEAGADSFRWQLTNFPDWYEIDTKMEAAFAEKVNHAEQKGLRVEFDRLCEVYHRADARVSAEDRQARNRLVGKLRGLLARTCLHLLEPDLIILDEFQRFKELLSTDSEAGQLAHDLFEFASSDGHSHARVLLLSATPYKMYTMGHELAAENHYEDFLQTIRFLVQNETTAKRVEGLLQEYRTLMYQIADGANPNLQRVRAELQTELRRVICRTERLAVTVDRSGMLQEMPCRPSLAPGDVKSYVSLQQIARSLGHGETVEYWKSAPYLLSFMEDYSLKELLWDPPDGDATFVAMTGRMDCVALPMEKIRNYESVDPHNPRMRELISQTVDVGAWEALWIPPALPYYELAGPIAELARRRFTKRLVFSSWKVVPKAIATMLSYEAECRLNRRFDAQARNTPEARKSQRALLAFTQSEGRLRGMPVLAMLYPSSWLAERVDPFRLMCQQSAGARLTASELLGLVEASLEPALADLTRDAPTTGAADEMWYWAAPILLDSRLHQEAATAWWDSDNLPQSWTQFERNDETESDGISEEEEDEDDDEGGGGTWQKHVDAARSLVQGTTTLGRPPEDLAQVMAALAVGGPAVCALRSFTRMGSDPFDTKVLKHRLAAGRVAWGFRSLFNAPETMALIRGRDGNEPYWRRVLEHCCDGCLQSVLDEYAHMLVADTRGNVNEIARTMVEALSIRTSSPGVDEISLNDQTRSISIEPRRLRARFAMRFGDEKSEDGTKTISRADQVRKAFNAPFWPFVLATTSVGQEGLDFHTYCHAVMHWNLPANPVDLEQREGRVHRYKGHAVRKNIALAYADKLRDVGLTDPWEQLFTLADDEHGKTSLGLIPFWVFPWKDGAVIERHVPALPLSRESEHLPALRRTLAVYRMAFGQPRQDDLASYLSRVLSPEEIRTRSAELGFDLSPSGSAWPLQ